MCKTKIDDNCIIYTNKVFFYSQLVRDGGKCWIAHQIMNLGFRFSPIRHDLKI